MSKKTLLNESTVRKFMKFANIGALTENFVSETYSMEEEEAEEGMRLEGEHAEGRHDEGRGDVMEGEHEEGMEDEGDTDMDAGDMDMDAGGAELDMSEDEAMALAQGLVDALTDLTGHEFTASSAGGAPDMDMPGDEGPEDAGLDMDMGDDDKGDDEDEVLEGVDMVDEEEVVSETLRRVTKRIKNMSKRNRMVETVTDRIMARIKNGE
tara:strand:- start:207 stop:833 length:627 start_codon:yes stop_codon:yes gene_type:complete